MSPQDCISKLESIRKIIICNPNADKRTKAQIITLFANVEDFIASIKFNK